MADNREQTEDNKLPAKQGGSLSSGLSGLSSVAFDTESTPMITPSEVIEHLFCPRFTYFMNCLDIPQHEDKRYKVLKGRELHERRETENRDYLRKRLGCVDKEISVYIASRKLGVRGIIDEVLHLSDGTLSPLDYKYTAYSDYTFETHRVQSVLYAMLIMENYQKSVTRGFICYAKGGSKVKEIAYRDGDFEQAKDVIREIFSVILRGYYPKKTVSQNRCVDCCYRNICV